MDATCKRIYGQHGQANRFGQSTPIASTAPAGNARRISTGNRSARLRELDTITGPRARSRSARVRDWSFAPRTIERWESGNGSKVVLRVSRPLTPYYPDHPGFEIDGLALDGVEGTKLYRMLYRDGQIRVVGHERRDGRLLWKLESHPEPHGIDDHTRLVMLVNPHTFLPVFARQIDIAVPGHPAIVESELLSYRTVAATTAGASVFDLAAQHPGTRVRHVAR